MNAKRAVSAVLTVAVFAAAGLLLYAMLSGGRSTMGPPTEADENPHTDAIVPVQVGTISKATVHRTLTVYGQVEPAPASADQPAAAAMVSVPSADLVADVTCAEGQSVKAGQVLFRLDARAADAQAAQAQALATAAAAAVDALHDAPAGSVPAWVITAAQWEKDSAQAMLDHARAQQQWRIVTAPMSGTVTAVNIRAGQVAAASTPAVEIVDLHRLVAALDVPGFDASSVASGQRVGVEMRTAAANSAMAPGASTRPSAIEGSIVRVDPAADASTGMVSVDVALPADSGLRPGQFVCGHIEIESHADCLVVPAAAIVTDINGQPRIALVEGMHRASFLPVVVGIRQGDTVEISAPGLAAGQPIVTGGAFALPPGGCNIQNVGP